MSVSPNRTPGEAGGITEPAQEEEEAEGRIASNMETTSQVGNVGLKLPHLEQIKWFKLSNPMFYENLFLISLKERITN